MAKQRSRPRRLSFSLVKSLHKTYYWTIHFEGALRQHGTEAAAAKDLAFMLTKLRDGDFIVERPDLAKSLENPKALDLGWLALPQLKALAEAKQKRGKTKKA